MIPFTPMMNVQFEILNLFSTEMWHYLLQQIPFCDTQWKNAPIGELSHAIFLLVFIIFWNGQKIRKIQGKLHENVP